MKLFVIAAICATVLAGCNCAKESARLAPAVVAPIPAPPVGWNNLTLEK